MGVPTWSWCRSAPQSCWRLAQGLPRARPAHGHARAFTSFKGVFALANYPKGLIKRQQLLFSALFAGCTGGRSLGGALRSSQSPCLQDAALFPLPFPYFTPHAPSPVPWAPRLSLGIWPGEIAVKSVVGGRICVS